MVQQLSLFGAIDDKSYDLFVATMTTKSGNPPILFTNLTSSWKPDPSYNIESVNSKNQLIEPTRIKVAKELPFKLICGSNEKKDYDYKILKTLNSDNIPVDLPKVKSMVNETQKDITTNPVTVPDDDKMEIDVEDNIETDNSENNNSENNISAWSMTISDIPAAGNNRKVSMQTISESVILDSAGQKCTLSNIMKELCYIEEYQYITVGVRFTVNQTVTLELQKIWDITNDTKRQITSGGYLIKAYINVKSSTDIDRIKQNENRLLGLQKELQGYVDLSIPDRKSMDSRMGYNYEHI